MDARSASGSRRTTTPCSACRRARPRRRSRAPTRSSPRSTTPTPTRATRTPRRGSRKSPPRTTCSATPRSARSTTRSGAWSRPVSARRRRAGGPGGFGGRAASSSTSTFGDRAAFSGPPRRPVRWPRAGAADGGARRSAARPGPRDRAAPRLRRRGPRRHQHGAVPRRCDVLDVPRHRAPRPGPRPRRARSATAAGRSRSTRVRSRSRRCAPRAAGAARSIPTPCPTCHGRGVEVRAREVKVRVPAGVADGQRIRVKGRGGAGANGGPPGDLYVVVHVRAAPAVRPQRQRPHVARAGHVRGSGARRRREGADARRPGDGADPAGHAERQGVARPRQGVRAANGNGKRRRPARHRRRAGARRAQRRAARRGRGARGGVRPTTRVRRCSRHAVDEPEGAPMEPDDRARSTSSRSRPSSPACTRRRCASTSARGYRARAHERPQPPLLRARHRAAAPHPGADQRGHQRSSACSGSSPRSTSSRTRGSASPSSRRSVDALQREMDDARRGRAPRVPARARPAPHRASYASVTSDRTDHEGGRRCRSIPNRFTRKTQEALGAAQAAGREAGPHRGLARAPAARAARPARRRRHRRARAHRRRPRRACAAGVDEALAQPPQRERRDRPRRAASRPTRSACSRRPTRSARSSTTSTCRPSTCCSR